MRSPQLCKRIKKQTELTDLISRADAMGAVQEHSDAGGFKGYDDGKKMMSRIMVVPSAEAPPYCALESGPSFKKPKTWHEKNSNTYICGDCGFEQAIYGNINEYNCCPRCGVYKEYVDYGCLFPQKRTPYREENKA